MIRTSVLAQAGRLDLRLPAGVSIAEVNAELAARLGLGSGLALHSVLGIRLDPDETVGAQISDGSVLQLGLPTTTRTMVFDDIADAVHEAVGVERTRSNLIGQYAPLAGFALTQVVALVATPLLPASPTVVVGSAALALGLLVAAVVCSVPHPQWAAVFVWTSGGYAAVSAHLAVGATSTSQLSGFTVPGSVFLVAACAWIGMEGSRVVVLPMGILGLCGLSFAWTDRLLTDRAVGTTVGLGLLALGVAILLLPRLSLAIAGLGSGLESSAVPDAVDRGHSALVVGIVSVGLGLVLLVPVAMTTQPATALLAVNVCVGLLLFSRSLPRWQMTAVALVLGSGALFLGSLVAITSKPEWRLLIAAVALAAGATSAVGAIWRGRFRARVAWLADGADWLTRFALLPLAVWALDLPNQAQRWGPW